VSQGFGSYSKDKGEEHHLLKTNAPFANEKLYIILNNIKHCKWNAAN
jgi:hypothetical protein